MKKIILGLAAVVMLSMTVSCKGGSAASTSSVDTTGLGDSLSNGFGEYQALGFLQYLMQMSPEEKEQFSKSDIIKGFKEMLMADTTNKSVQIGRQMGMQVLGQIQQIEQNSTVRFDRDLVLKAFENTLKLDSVSPDQMQNVQMTMQGLDMQLRKNMEEYHKQQALAKPEVQKNVKAGEEFIAKKMKEDNTLKKTQSGLVYKVNKEGAGDKVTLDKVAKINYSGKLIDGTEFDAGQAVEMDPNRVIPGFQEALQLMQKGGSYTIYIPGDLAYGVNGIPGKIDPMSTLVFDIEVLDITEPKAQDNAQPQQVKVQPAK